MNEIKEITGQIVGVHEERISLRESFLDFSRRFASMESTAVFMSGGDLDCARYHILAAKPWLTLKGRHRNLMITASNQSIEFKTDPFDILHRILNAFRLNDLDIDPSGLTRPIAAGLFGYLSYDLKDALEKLPRTSIDDLMLPHLFFFAPSIIVVHDKAEDMTRLCIPIRRISGQDNLDRDLKTFKHILGTKTLKKQCFSGDPDGFKSNFTQTGYMAAVKKIKEYIAAGDVYQVNISQRFEMDFAGDAFSLFVKLHNDNPAPFFAYIHAGDHQVVSTSPERFLAQTADRLETRPIKGTRPRGKTPTEDETLGRELKNSQKDDAELSMIVDLLRNDIGKVCRAGTVRVAEHKRLEAYRNVFHLVSIVNGLLDRDSNSVDLLKATFPGGSITGCPKIRSMEIIDELEPHRRHIYTGSIGYISFHDTLDFSIAIRTATITNGKIIFSVGGGIVFDSEPLEEYDETLHKGRTLMEAFKGKEKPSSKKNCVWINGALVPLEKAAIPVSDLGFQYGFGFFETIRVDKGNPKHLKAHVNRFYRTWKKLFSENPPDLTWNEIIHQVIDQNRLMNDIAVVKIMATRGDRGIAPYNHTLVVMARSYTHRLADKKDPGLHLAIYPHPRQTPLADYKTLNYLYYFLAGKWAQAQNADEALILNPDNTVSETNTANILLIKEKTAVQPESLHVLPGIMESVVGKILMSWNYKVEKKIMQPQALFDADEVLITNSLMGTVPVLSLDGKFLSKPSDLWKKINEGAFR